MKNLYELTKVGDSGFLNFLYSERKRQQGKRGAPGWSLWALFGTAFALLVFIYRSVKVEESIDILLCYYIFSVFCPIVLYSIFIMELIRSMSYGDSKHVERLKNIAPITLLVCLFCVYTILTVVGLFLGASSYSVISCAIVLISIVVSFLKIAYDRNKLVTTFLSFRVSAQDSWNKTLMFVLSGSLLLPLSGAFNQLAFGFSSEFEITFAVVILVSIIYIFIKHKVNGNRVAEIDELIDGFLYRDWTKKSIIRKLELLKLGKAAFMELETEYNNIIEASSLLDNSKKRAQEISAKVQEPGLTLDEVEKFLSEIQQMSDVLANVMSGQKRFHDKAKELLDLKTTINDSEFRVMLDTMYDITFAKKVFEDCKQLMDMIKDKIFPQLQAYVASIKEDIACCKKCPHRIN